MLIIRDYDLPAWAPDSRKLGLSGDELTLDGRVPALGREETVCFLTGLGNGGKAHQIQLIRSNPGVKRWIVVIFSDDTDAVAQYRENLEHTGRNIRSLVWKEDGAEVLRGMLAHSGDNRCLIYTKHPHPGLRGFSGYLGSLLPRWEFCEASGDPDPLQGSWSQRILAGSTLEDFLVDLPDTLVQIPFFVLLNARESVQMAIHPGELTARIAEHYRKTFRWNSDKIARRFYITDALYEDWSSFCREHPENIPMLRNDPRLSVWDRYGLPLPVEEVSDWELLAFLSSFTGCADLASALKHLQKG